MSELESVSDWAIIGWLRKARSKAHRSAGADELNRHGIGWVGLLVSPLFLNLLAAARGRGLAGNRESLLLALARRRGK